MSPGSSSALVRLTLSGGLALIAVAVLVTLSRSPPVLAGTNSVAPDLFVAATNGNAVYCQAGERLPAGTTAIRLWVNTNISPPTQVAVLAGSLVLTRGRQQPGRLATTIAIPVTPLARTFSDVKVCFKLGPAVEQVRLLGGEVPHSRPGEPPVKIRVEYLRAGRSTWWDLVRSIARRIGLGRAPSGTWAVLVPVVSMAAAILLTVWLLLRELGDGPRESPAAQRRVIPAPALICGAIACLSAVSWTVLTPPFEVPDEPSHFAYVQQLAEAGSLPTSSTAGFSKAEDAALEDLREPEVRLNSSIGTISTAAQQRRLERDLARPFARRGPGGAGVASTEPPLYYTLEAVPYLLGSSGSLLDQLELMRLLSASMAGLTALFVFLFLREALPGLPWTWTMGALASALAPLVGFTTGAVTPDSMLCALSAALFYCLARAFRRGLTRRAAAALGVLMAIGLLTKLNFVGLLPGVGVGLLVLARRAARGSRRAALQALVVAVVIPAVVVCVYGAVNVLSSHPALGVFSRGAQKTGHHGSLLGELSFVWQFYLPRLPGMIRYFPGVSTTAQVWFDRLVGVYGWQDTYFPGWVVDAALAPVLALLALCARVLWAGRGALRVRAGEALCYAMIGGGVLALVGADAYLSYPVSEGGYAEPRYLLPLVALFAGGLVLAVRGLGRRWGPVVGVLIVLPLLLAQRCLQPVVGRRALLRLMIA